MDQIASVYASDDSNSGSSLIGRNAREIRRSLKMTLDEVAEKTGLSKSHLSRFERGNKTLSIAALMKVSTALGVGPTSLFGASSQEGQYHVVRAEEKATIQAEVSHGSYSYTFLSRGNRSALNAFKVTLRDNATRAGEVAHSGEEGCLVLSGEIVLTLGTQAVVLKEGDYVQFAGSINHTMRTTAKESQVLVVVAAS